MNGSDGIRFDSAKGRWVLAVTVLGSGVAFLEATVVNVALPEIGRDLDADTAGLQWVLNGYLLTLASLILLGGSLGDRLGRRRIFNLGVVWFTAASVLCAVAPNVETLIAARVLQGRGRRPADPRQPGDHRGHVPQGRPRAGDRRLVGPRRGGRRRRPAAGRLPGRLGLLARDLPAEHPAGGVRGGDGQPPCSRDQGPGRHRPAGLRRRHPRRGRPGRDHLRADSGARGLQRDAGAHRRGAGGGGSCRLPLGRAQELQPDDAARGLRLQAVHRREPRDLRGLRRAGRRLLPARGLPADLARLLGDRGRGSLPARHRS